MAKNSIVEKCTHRRVRDAGARAEAPRARSWSGAWRTGGWLQDVRADRRCESRGVRTRVRRSGERKRRRQSRGRQPTPRRPQPSPRPPARPPRRRSTIRSLHCIVFILLLYEVLYALQWPFVLKLIYSSEMPHG